MTPIRSLTLDRKESWTTTLPSPLSQTSSTQNGGYSKYLPRTPLIRYDNLGEMVSAEVYVKHENHLPTNAFKVRGGVNLVSQTFRGRSFERGCVSASTGNHAQSIAYASRLFGVRATIVMPVNANPLKVEATKRLGADRDLTGKRL